MAVLTRERLSELIGMLTEARAELSTTHPELASRLEGGTGKLKDLVDAGDLDGAEQWALGFWQELFVDFPLVQRMATRGGKKPPQDRDWRAPGQDPVWEDPGLEQTEEAIEKFNWTVKKIGGLLD